MSFLQKQGVTVRSSDIFKLLGYSEHRSLKKVIWANKEAFEKRGVLKKESFKKDVGRPDENYLLSFEQFLLLTSLVKNTDGNNKIKLSVINSVIDGYSKASLFAVIDMIKGLDVSDIEPDRFVYVAKESISGRYKIGISKNPEKRIKELNTGNPEQLILVHAYLVSEQGNLSESLAHSIFEENRLKGEWFKENIDLNLLPSYSGHIDSCDCQCNECLSYKDALHYVDDIMTPYQALTAIVENTDISHEKAKIYVDSMIETGYINEQ